MRATLLVLIMFLISAALYAQVNVKGYYRSNGTYVEPHVRTYPNNTVTDNYSYPGNYNPNTGRVTGGSTYTYSKIDSYYDSRSTDWGAIGRADLKGFDRSKNYVASTKSSYTSSKNFVPKYVPYSKRNYLVTPKGNRYGYSYCVESTMYKRFYIYDLENALQFWINQYPNGDMYLYNPQGNFVQFIPKK